MFVLVIVSFVVVRLNNTPPGNYVTRNGVVHHGGYDGNDVTIINNHYGNRWGTIMGPGFIIAGQVGESDQPGPEVPVVEAGRVVDTQPGVDPEGKQLRRREPVKRWW